MNEPKNLTTHEFAKLHGVKDITVHKWIERDKLKPKPKKFGSQYMIPEDTPRPIDGRCKSRS